MLHDLSFSVLFTLGSDSRQKSPCLIATIPLQRSTLRSPLTLVSASPFPAVVPASRHPAALLLLAWTLAWPPNHVLFTSALMITTSLSLSLRRKNHSRSA